MNTTVNTNALERIVADVDTTITRIKNGEGAQVAAALVLVDTETYKALPSLLGKVLHALELHSPDDAKTPWGTVPADRQSDTYARYEARSRILNKIRNDACQAQHIAA